MPKKKTTKRSAKRVLSGLGARPKRKRAKKTGSWRRVSRKAATKRGKGGRRVLKKGCKYVKGDGALCRGAAAKRTTKRATKKRAAAKKVHHYSPNSPLPFKKGKTKKKVLKKGCRRVTSGKFRNKIVCSRKMTRRKRAA